MLITTAVAFARFGRMVRVWSCYTIRRYTPSFLIA
jgi:hypothetical protein